MNVDLEPGTYVIAVSGGVDSVVLLDLLVQQYGSPVTSHQSPVLTEARSQKTDNYVRLVVAHFDHGIRADSELDRELVQDIASQHGLSFVFDEGKLGSGASEAAARSARYKFLHKVCKTSGADAIITAHHQDDLIETALLNLLRGTGRKGLSSLGDAKHLRRPLLHIPKKALYAHAKKHGLKWREDVTNQDMKYHRNYVREHIVKKLSPAQRQQLLKLLLRAKDTNQELDLKIANLLQITGSQSKLDRKMFINLPHKVSLEIMAAWLRKHDIHQFDKKLLEKLVTACKTLTPGKQIDVDATHIIKITKQKLSLEKRKR